MNLITFAYLTDGTIARSMLNYPSQTEAISALYSTMASATANKDCQKNICLLMTDDGRTTKYEKWERESVFSEVSVK